MKREESILGAGLVFEGKVEGNGNVRLAGCLRGHLVVSGDVTVEPDGAIEGDVKADRVRIAGQAKANISATSAVELAGSASLVGDIKAPSVQLNAGARIRGSVHAGWGAGDDHTNGAPAGPTPSF